MAARLFGGGPDDYYYAFFPHDGSPAQVSPNAPVPLPAPALSDQDTLTHYRTRAKFREAIHCSYLANCVVTGRSLATEDLEQRDFALLLAAAGLLVLMIGLGISWWMAERVLGPISQIADAANRISSGNLAERINVPDPHNELGSLAYILNSTFARLEASFEQQRRFTADAAHELRTPLTVLISETQTALARERDAAAYRNVVESCHNTAQQMRRLTESLLLLSRLDAEPDAASLSRTRFDFAEIILACVKKLHPLAEQRSISIATNLAPAPVRADRDRLTLVVNNVIINAIDFSLPGGEICVSTALSATGEQAVFTTRDSGCGIDSEDLPHIFERFYQADKSRSRSNGHAGLGLAITKAIVMAEGGVIEATSRLNGGATFAVRLPAAQGNPS